MFLRIGALLSFFLLYIYIYIDNWERMDLNLGSLIHEVPTVKLTI